LVVVELVEQGDEGTGLGAFARDLGGCHHGRVVVSGRVEDHRARALALPCPGSALGLAVGGVAGFLVRRVMLFLVVGAAVLALGCPGRGAWRALLGWGVGVQASQ